MSSSKLCAWAHELYFYKKQNIMFIKNFYCHLQTSGFQTDNDIIAKNFYSWHIDFITIWHSNWRRRTTTLPNDQAVHWCHQNTLNLINNDVGNTNSTYAVNAGVFGATLFNCANERDWHHRLFSAKCTLF